jgi:hypothetical protein
VIFCLKIKALAETGIAFLREPHALRVKMTHPPRVARNVALGTKVKLLSNSM